jgi:hypothetical protein
MTFRSTLFALLALACAAAVPPPAYADARGDVQAAFRKVLDAGGFRGYARGRVFGPDLPAASGEIEVVFPDRIHARTETMEFVVTSEGAWLSVLGAWAPVDRSMVPVTAFDRRAMQAAIASIHDASELGRSTLRACEARVYRFRASGQLPGASADGDMRVWVCAADGRPARLEAADANGGERLSLDFDWSRRARVDSPED